MWHFVSACHSVCSPSVIKLCSFKCTLIFVATKGATVGDGNEQLHFFRRPQGWVCFALVLSVTSDFGFASDLEKPPSGFFKMSSWQEGAHDITVTKRPLR